MNRLCKFQVKKLDEEAEFETNISKILDDDTRLLDQITFDIENMNEYRFI